MINNSWSEIKEEQKSTFSCQKIFSCFFVQMGLFRVFFSPYLLSHLIFRVIFLTLKENFRCEEDKFEGKFLSEGVQRYLDDAPL